MTHSEKIMRLYQHLPELGIPPLTAVPPLYRILWRFGVEIPPPLFVRFSTLALTAGGFFAVGFGSFLWLFSSLDPTPSAISIPVISLLAGILFGLAMAAHYRHIARQASLPSWFEYTGQAVGA
jgi:hypothetical protein